MADKPNSSEERNVPASVIFTELMRQAARKSQQDSPTNLNDSDADSQHDNETHLSEDELDALQEQEPLSLEEIADKIELPPLPEFLALQGGRLTPEEAYQVKLDYQRIRRIQRRRAQKRQRNVGAFGGFWQSMVLVLIAAGLISTIFTWFTDPASINPKIASNLNAAQALAEPTAVPTAIPTPRWLKRIGIVAGHRGPEDDPGAICPDGLTEVSINFTVAQYIINDLRSRGYDVDLLDEFDPRLNNYQAAALVSIHSNTCQQYEQVVSGYMVAKAAARPDGGLDVQLAECIAGHYGYLTELERRYTLTADMTNYHTFREIHQLTPAAIVELGFMLADRELLTETPELLAQGITNGILCFLDPTLAPRLPPTPTPQPTPTT